MPDIARIIAEGAANPWLYLPAALLLGALHALEPGHAKSIMAAFIIAVRGTPAQAVLLGLSAALGHTIVVWALVLAALWFGNDLLTEQALPWLSLATGLVIIAIALRLLWSQRSPGPRHHDDHDQGHHHQHRDHDHGHHDDHNHDHDHDHDYDHDKPTQAVAAFVNPADAAHGHSHADPDAIASRYAGRTVRPWEVFWFGFTGGLLPCPSAIAVLLVALKFNAIALGAVMVGAFSLGLAATLVTVGLIAAWGTRRAIGLPGMTKWAHRLPVISASIVLLLGAALTLQALLSLYAA